MLKQLFYFFIFLTTTISFAQGLTATQKIPAEILAGNDFVIETTINRDTITGFTKFFQPLPEGFTAKAIESKGGSFAFAENGAKVVWLYPPAELNYTFSYKVSVPKNASGSKLLGGKISYITNSNLRKVVDLETKTVTVSNNSAIVRIEPTAPSAKSSNEINKIIEKTKIASNQPVVSPVVPVTAMPSSVGRTFRVQIGAFNLKPKITGVPEPTTIVLENGMTKYFSGNFGSIETAEKRKKEMVGKGFKDAFIVAFENGKIMRK